MSPKNYKYFEIPCFKAKKLILLEGKINYNHT